MTEPAPKLPTSERGRRALAPPGSVGARMLVYLLSAAFTQARFRDLARACSPENPNQRANDSRAGAVLKRLVRHGLLINHRRGVYVLSDEGISFAVELHRLQEEEG